MPKSRIFNVANMFLTLFAKIKFSRKFPNLQYMQQVPVSPGLGNIGLQCIVDTLTIL